MKKLLLAFCLTPFGVGVAWADSLYVRVVGRYDMLLTAYSVAPVGDYVYIANVDTLRVVSVANPAHPVEVGHCGALGEARGVAVSGDYAYVADMDSSLRVFSIADPVNPVEVGRCRTPEMAMSVVVSGGYAYVGLRDSGLRVISVADPSHPTEVAHCGRYYVYDLDVCGGYVYAAATSGGLRIISVANPAHPTEVGYYNTRGDVEGVAVSGEHAYVVSTDSTFRVLSISDPTDPVEVGSCWTPWAPQDVAVVRNYAFVANWGGGLQVIEIADPAHLADVGHYTFGESWSIAYNRDLVYLTAHNSLVILKFYQLGDLDVDPDSLDVVADTLRLRDWTTVPGESLECVRGDFILANTSASYNPDTTDGPSRSPVDSLSFSGSLTGPGGTIDSIVIPNLPSSLAQGQTMVCTLAAYVPVGLRDGDYTGSIYISGKDTAHLLVQCSCYVLVRKLGDLDVDPDSLDVVADTIRLTNPGSKVTGEFILANTSQLYNPDTSDGPSKSPVDSLRFTGSLAGPGGTLDSIRIPNLPKSLAQGQTIVCTLAVYVPPGLRDGDYAGSITITGKDSVGALIQEIFSALLKNVLGDLDIDHDSLGVAHDTMNLHTQPAGPVYHPYAKAEFMLVNTSSSYNPDAEDGPSRSTLREVEVEAKVEARGRAAPMVNSKYRIVKSGSDFHSSQFTLDSSAVGIYVLNLPESLAVGQAVECTLALVLPVGATPDGYTGWVTISAMDTLGYQVQDSFATAVRGPEPRQNLDSLRVAPIPFKPNQNPEHDAIHFQGLSAGARVIVYDASGQSVWSATESGDGHLKWDAKVASGIYVYLVVAKDGESKVGKLSVIR
jgi:hypothetical protein